MRENPTGEFKVVPAHLAPLLAAADAVRATDPARPELCSVRLEVDAEGRATALGTDSCVLVRARGDEPSFVGHDDPFALTVRVEGSRSRSTLHTALDLLRHGGGSASLVVGERVVRFEVGDDVASVELHTGRWPEHQRFFDGADEVRIASPVPVGLDSARLAVPAAVDRAVARHTVGRSGGKWQPSDTLWELVHAAEGADGGVRPVLLTRRGRGVRLDLVVAAQKIPRP